MKKTKGFTLIEMIVSVSLFTVIAFFSIGSLYSIYDAHRKAQNSKTVMDNLNLSIENMTRSIRFGTNYFCGTSSDLAATADCPNGDSAISVTFNGIRVIYRLNGTAIERSDDGGVNYASITSGDTVVDVMKFYVAGSNSTTQSPYVVAVIKGYVGKRPTSQTIFSLQTLMSQRDLGL